MAKITIYKDINFGGQSWEYNDSKSNFKDDGFGDKWPLHVGLYATPKLGDFNNDAISSVKLK